jgi:predicted nucleic acid-binding protein
VTAPLRGILDTSVFIARESGRPLDEAALPEESAISVVTLAELHAGVLAAATTDVRAQRMATLTAVADMAVLPIEEEAAIMWARMRVHLMEAGRRVNVNDLWIAATAAALGLPVITQDGDFQPLAGVAGLTVIEA